MKNNKNKKGWIRVFEAITAIFLIAIVVLIILANSTVKEDNFFKEIYNAEIFILRDIQLNNTLRTEIINVATLPTEWDSVSFPSLTKARIINKTPSYINCSAKICDTGDTCLLAGAEDKSIYAENVIITATNTEYNPRQLKLFCWEA